MNPDGRTAGGRIALGVLALLILSLGTATFFLKDEIEARVLTHSLRFFTGPFAERQLMEFGWLNAHPVAISVEGKVIDYARSGRNEAAIVAYSAEGGDDVALIENGKEKARLTMDGGVKSFLALSPDGTQIAYAVRDLPSEGISKPFYDIDAWQVVTLEVASGVSTVRGRGYGPQFFEREGATFLSYDTPEGLATLDMASGEVTADGSVVISDARVTSAVSGDGTQRAFFDAASLEYVASLQDEGLILPASAYLVAAEGDRLYAAAAEASSSKLLIYRFSDPTAPPLERSFEPLQPSYRLLP